MTIPKIIFIVPYRDREAQKNMFIRMMDYVLEDVNNEDYEIYFSHQKDERPFNRGAMKNLGFIHIRDKYPMHYKEMTFVFNDVDTLPGIKNLWDYNTKAGSVKHFYGYTFALGGIVSILGKDFERINGYPSYWGWGCEDNCLQYRCMKKNIKIDRSIFYPVKHNSILQFNNEFRRPVDKSQFLKVKQDNGTNGINTIVSINKNEESIDSKHFMIHFTSWEIPQKYNSVKLEDITHKKELLQNNPRNSIMNSIINR